MLSVQLTPRSNGGQNCDTSRPRCFSFLLSSVQRWRRGHARERCQEGAGSWKLDFLLFFLSTLVDTLTPFSVHTVGSDLLLGLCSLCQFTDVSFSKILQTISVCCRASGANLLPALSASITPDSFPLRGPVRLWLCVTLISSLCALGDVWPVHTEPPQAVVFFAV